MRTEPHTRAESGDLFRPSIFGRKARKTGKKQLSVGMAGELPLQKKRKVLKEKDFMSSSDVTMDIEQEQALMRLLENQFGALAESEEGVPREEEPLFTSDDLERLEPLRRFLGERSGGSKDKPALKLYFPRD